MPIKEKRYGNCGMDYNSGCKRSYLKTSMTPSDLNGGR